MSAAQWAVLAIGVVVVPTLAAWVTSVRTWRRRNRDWRDGRLS